MQRRTLKERLARWWNLNRGRFIDPWAAFYYNHGYRNRVIWFASAAAFTSCFSVFYMFKVSKWSILGTIALALVYYAECTRFYHKLGKLTSVFGQLFAECYLALPCITLAIGGVVRLFWSRFECHDFWTVICPIWCGVSSLFRISRINTIGTERLALHEKYAIEAHTCVKFIDSLVCPEKRMLDLLRRWDKEAFEHLQDDKDT